jgi:hypothetical protein
MAKGLQGTAHFRNSVASNEDHEPLYQNLFSAQLIGLPTGLGSKSNNTLIIEGVQKISGLDFEQTPLPVEQTYKGAKRSYAQALPEKTNTDIKIDLAVNLNKDNEAYIYNFFREWSNLVWHPLTGEMQLKKDYIATSIMISMYNRVGTVYRRVVGHKIFPSAPLTSFELGYAEGNSLYQLSVSLRCDYWDDVSRGLIEL